MIIFYVLNSFIQAPVKQGIVFDYFGFDIDEEMLEEATRILNDGFTLYYDQQFTMGELVEYCRRIGSTDDDVLGYMQFNPEEYPDISIVSPKPDMLLGHCDLEWH